jgi:hypothetical protein
LGTKTRWRTVKVQLGQGHAGDTKHLFLPVWGQRLAGVEGLSDYVPASTCVVDVARCVTLPPAH